MFWTWYTVYFSDMSCVQNMFEVIKGKILLYTIVPEKRKVGAYITIFPACLVPSYFGVIACDLCDENVNFTQSFREIFTALR